MTLFLIRETLAALCHETRLLDMRLTSCAGQGRLRLMPKPGHLTRFRAEAPLDLVFSPGRLLVVFTPRAGARQAIAVEEEDGLLFQRLNEPLRLFTEEMDGTPAEPPGEPPPHAFTLRPDLLRMLFRHAAIGDMLFGSDGRECTFQIQLAHGFAGTDPTPPRDWVGLEFDDRRVTLGWFDWTGAFRDHALALPEEAEAAERLAADPLGLVLRQTLDQRISEAETGVAALLKRLEAGLSPSA